MAHPLDQVGAHPLDFYSVVVNFGHQLVAELLSLQGGLRPHLLDFELQARLRVLQFLAQALLHLQHVLPAGHVLGHQVTGQVVQHHLGVLFPEDALEDALHLCVGRHEFLPLALLQARKVYPRGAKRESQEFTRESSPLMGKYRSVL